MQYGNIHFVWCGCMVCWGGKMIFSGILMQMIIDGNAIAKDIYREIANKMTHISHTPHLTIFSCAPNFETKKYLNLKKQKSMEIGITVDIIELPNTVTTMQMVQSIENSLIKTDGILIQLPLPNHIDIQIVIAAIPVGRDVDGMRYDGTSGTFMSPVVCAMSEITQRHNVSLISKDVVIVGKGRLVGAPSALWAISNGAQVTVLTKNSGNTESAVSIAAADIIIMGAGVPNLLQPEMIKEGVVIFDAGTSESEGKLTGDVHPDCAKKASISALVPGGIGPISIAALLRNVVTTVV